MPKQKQHIPANALATQAEAMRQTAARLRHEAEQLEHVAAQLTTKPRKPRAARNGSKTVPQVHVQCVKSGRVFSVPKDSTLPKGFTLVPDPKTATNHPIQ